MEDAADTVVPLRPGFEVQVRGFNRNQVLEHIELLEDQLKLVTFDRNEAVAVNEDLRKLCDDTRHQLDESEQRLKRIESSDTGLPAASQRVQNMLDTAEEEVQTLREQSRRQAETIRGTAETEARQLLEQARAHADELRRECAELSADLQAKQERMRQEHAKNVREMREREQRLRKAVRDEYKKRVAAAEQEAADMLARTQEQCAERDAATEQHRVETLEELRTKRSEFEELRQSLLAMLGRTRDTIESSTQTLNSAEVVAAQDGGSETGGSDEADGDDGSDPQLADGANGHLHLPEQRHDTRTFTVPLKPTVNGSGQDPEAHDNAQWN